MSWVEKGWHLKEYESFQKVILAANICWLSQNLSCSLPVDHGYPLCVPTRLIEMSAPPGKDDTWVTRLVPSPPIYSPTMYTLEISKSFHLEITIFDCFSSSKSLKKVDIDPLPYFWYLFTHLLSVCTWKCDLPTYHRFQSKTYKSNALQWCPESFAILFFRGQPSPLPLFLNFNPIVFLVAEHFVEMSIFTVYISITQFFQQILHSHIFFKRKKGQVCNYSLHQICWIKTKTQFLDEEVIFWQINGKKNLRFWMGWHSNGTGGDARTANKPNTKLILMQ